MFKQIMVTIILFIVCSVLQAENYTKDPVMFLQNMTTNVFVELKNNENNLNDVVQSNIIDKCILPHMRLQRKQFLHLNLYYLRFQ